MDREQAEVYKIMADMVAKMFLVGVSTLVFLVVTGFLLYNPNWYFAAFDGVCSYSIGRVIIHYFPARSRNKGKKLPKK